MTGRNPKQGRRIANLVIFVIALSLVVGGFAWRFSSGGGIQEWLGTGQGDHAHLAGGFSSPLLDVNESWNRTFAKEGLYAYSCHPHPFMNGSIRVTRSNASALPGTVDVRIRNLSYEPAYLEVAPGTVVRWTNEDPVQHNAVQVAISKGVFGLSWWEATLVGVVLLASIVLIAAKFTGRRPRPGNPAPKGSADKLAGPAPETGAQGGATESIDGQEESR